MSEARLREVEGMEGAATTGELNNVARLFGVEVEEFLQGEQGPAVVLFRSLRAELSLEDVLPGDDSLVLGDFLRCAGRVKRLRDLLADPLPPSTWQDQLTARPLDDSEPYEQGERLAREARLFLRLGDDPIPSMRELLREQGVELFALPPGALHAPIDGACTLQWAPAILTNPLYDAAPWRLRATMAHELCHLLFDRGVLGSGRPLFLFSPTSEARKGKGKRKWGLFDDYLRLEQRANAFASYFLAPRQSVLKVLQGILPTSSAAPHRLCSEFGIGVEMAVNLITNIFQLQAETRQRLLASARELTSSFAYDEAPACAGLYTGQLRELALRALAAGRISPVEARQLLDVPMDEELPQGTQVRLSDAQRAPIISPEQRVLKRASHYLITREEGGALYPGAVTRTDDGWCVEVLKLEDDGPPTRVAALRLSFDLVPIRLEFDA